ncbi:MAG: thiosulfate oxidation carrier complex protein SoxZ [Aquincola sp.]|nr:thiosulfate oxidation carrier complex protein SoxZ [Aquincola sp.]|tara:strand:+ start:120 stop:434 length:315 start_codon:yes stop_codon:yes gene_type:complete
MAEGVLVRARATADGRAVVRLLMAHDMETGLRQDASGQRVPAWYITEVTVMLAGETVLQAQWGTAVSKNPSLQFTLRGVQPGDQVKVAWLDNRGQRGVGEGVVG